MASRPFPCYRIFKVTFRFNVFLFSRINEFVFYLCNPSSLSYYFGSVSGSVRIRGSVRGSKMKEINLDRQISIRGLATCEVIQGQILIEGKKQEKGDNFDIYSPS